MALELECVKVTTQDLNEAEVGPRCVLNVAVDRHFADSCTVGYQTVSCGYGFNYQIDSRGQELIKAFDNNRLSASDLPTTVWLTRI